MIKTAYCKINLTLEILGTKRGDGFHDLKSVMHKIPLGDIIELTVNSGDGKVHISCSDNVCENKDNLAYLAARAYIDEYEKNNKADFDVFINLTKVTPTGAGLGGGSADAACVLDMLCSLVKGMDENAVQVMASALGSDVVFCLDRYKSGYCTGRGEICTCIDTLPENTCIVVAKPEDSLNTKGIYKRYDELYGDDYDKCHTDKMVDALKKGNLLEIAELCVNDFEEVCIPRLPEIDTVKRRMKELGACVSMMSGSGSAVFGLFSDEKACANCEKTLKSDGLEQVFAFYAADFKKMYNNE